MNQHTSSERKWESRLWWFCAAPILEGLAKLRQLARPEPLTRLAPRRPAFRPQLEGLELRDVPATLTIFDTRDSSIFSENNNSNGASYDLFTGRANGGGSRRALIYFDLSGLPAGAEITGVSLTMRMSGGAPSGVSGHPVFPNGYKGPLDISLYQVLADWGAGSSGAGLGNGGTSMGGAGGDSPGFAPTTGDATWTYRMFNTTSWTTPGGDFDATASATRGVDFNPQFVTWSSQGLINDVQEWVNNPATNFGWLIKGDERSIGTSRRFVSNDIVSDPTKNQSYRPVLTVDYSAAPTGVSAGGPYAITEGNDLTLNAGATDPDGDTLSYSWDINGDGTYGDVTGANPTLTWAQLNALGIVGPGAINNASVRVSDGFGPAVTSSPTTLTIGSADPTATLSGNSAVDEGTTYTLGLASGGPGVISSWTITWGDGSAPQTVNGNPSSVTHVFADGNNNYTITATVTNDFGTFATGNTVAVTVNNVAPALTISGPSSSPTGAAYALDLSRTDPGADTVTAWTVNWGDGTIQTFPGGSTSVTHVYGKTGLFTITATATDEDGTFAASGPVIVSVAPDASSAPSVRAVGAGFVGVYNGDGSLRGIFAPFPGYSGPVSTAMTDLTGDGVPDLITGGPGLLGVTDLTTGASFALPLFGPAYSGPVSVLMTDLTGDGRAEILFGGAGSLGVIDLATGGFALLPVFGGYTGPVNLTFTDVNGDGRDDLIFGGGGFLGMFNAATGTFGLLPLFGPAFTGDISVAAGDVNGDGITDILIGGAGSLGVFDPASGAFAQLPALPGDVTVATGDVNGDGRDDILVGGSGLVGALDGSTGKVLDARTGNDLMGLVPRNRSPKL